MQNLRILSIQYEKLVNNSIKQVEVGNKINSLKHNMNINVLKKATKDFYADKDNFELMKFITEQFAVSDINLKSYETWLGMNGNERD